MALSVLIPLATLIVTLISRYTTYGHGLLEKSACAKAYPYGWHKLHNKSDGRMRKELLQIQTGEALVKVFS